MTSRKQFCVDFPDPDNPGHFLEDPVFFKTRAKAVTFCAQWGAVDGKLDLISEIDIGVEEDEEEDS